MIRYKIFATVLFFVIQFGCTTIDINAPFYESEQVLGLVLTWQNDPTTTMTIDWHVLPESGGRLLQYRKEGDTDWLSAEAVSSPFPFSNRIINRVELTGLEPGTYYEFMKGGLDVIFLFRTMPATADLPIRFAVGGDILRERSWMEETNREAALYDPDFIVWGGDLANADGREDRLERWYDFFKAMRNTLILANGRVIPVVVTLGNHEVIDGYFYHYEDASISEAFRELIAPYFYKLFAMPGHPGYNVLDFGNYLSLILLDSGHTNPVDSVQAEWLNGVLSERIHIPHVFPVYHVSAFPAFRPYDNNFSRLLRENWIPIFESYRNIRVVFEHHEHLYKRTYPIREESVNANGIVYLGSGGWGEFIRVARGGHETEDEGWYLKVTESKRHFILVTIEGTHQHFLAVSHEGEIIDEYPSVSR